MITNITIDQMTLSKDARNIIEEQNSFLLVNLLLTFLKKRLKSLVKHNQDYFIIKRGFYSWISFIKR